MTRLTSPNEKAENIRRVIAEFKKVGHGGIVIKVFLCCVFNTFDFDNLKSDQETVLLISSLRNRITHKNNFSHFLRIKLSWF